MEKTTKYIYRLFIDIRDKNSTHYNHILCENYFTREKAIQEGIKFINWIVRSECNNIDDFLIKYDCYFTIYITNLNHIDFETRKDATRFYKENAPINDKSKMYDFLTMIATESYEEYDYNGNFIIGRITTEISKHYDVAISYKSKFEPITNLKLGDLVKKKGYNDIYKITGLRKYLSDDILNYTDNVMISPLNDEEDEEEYSYTELIKVED